MQVSDHQIDALTLKQSERLFGGASYDDLDAVRSQHFGQDRGVVGGIVDEPARERLSRAHLALHLTRRLDGMPAS